jgi:hypothetical protein
MKFNKLNAKSIKNVTLASIFALSLGFGVMYASEKINFSIIEQEEDIISEMTDKTLNISFVPTNPDMKNNAKLFAPITQSDVENIEKIQGVKNVKPVDETYNPLAGYAKIDSKSSYVELYGWDESGNDRYRESVEIIYGRNINQADEGQNVIVINMETVNDMQISDAKSLIGTGVEINDSLYEIIGIMNAVISDTRDNSNEVEYASLIPKTTSKEILARANASSNIYTSIMVELEDGVNANSVETLIYSLLYDSHSGINGFYEKNSDYSLPIKLDPTLTIMDNYRKLSMATFIFTTIVALIALVKLFINNLSKKEVEEIIEAEELVKVEEINVSAIETELVEDKNSDAEEIEEVKETKKSVKLNMGLVESASTLLLGAAVSCFISSYYIANMSDSAVFNTSLLTKFIIIVLAIITVLVKLVEKEENIEDILDEELE